MAIRDLSRYELQVLKGAMEMLPKITLIESELSLIPLYENQVLYREIIDYLAEKGFALVYIQNGFMDRRGHILQADAIFVNTQKLRI